ncbi:MAG TPA: hypothetical protein V6C52_10445 [Coleofasciculaceae cyanobacterium]
MGIGILYWWICDPQIVGFDMDDGIYAISGKSLAEGHGFRLIHLIGNPAQVKYPVLYPALLSVVWWLNPHFPQNIPWMQALTIGLSLGGFGGIYLYFRRIKHLPPWQAALLVILVASCPAAMRTCTSIFSDGPFLLFSFLALFWAETYRQKPSGSRLAGLIFCSSLAFHTRVIATVLIAAISLWLGLQGRRKAAIVYAGLTGLLTVLPWGLWVYLNTLPPLDASHAAITNSFYNNYTFEWAHNYSFHTILAEFLDNTGAMLQSIALNMLPLLGIMLDKLAPNAGAGTARGIAITVGVFILVVLIMNGLKGSRRNEAVISKPGRMSWLASLPLAVLYVGMTLLMIALWGYQEQMVRFLLPVMPILWYYTLKPLFVLPQGAQPHGFRTLLLVVLLFAVLSPVPKIYWSSYRLVRSNHLRWQDHRGYQREIWGEYQNMFQYMNAHIPNRLPLGVNNESVFFLYTGHPGYSLNFWHFKTDPKINQSSPTFGKTLLGTFRTQGLRYLIVEPALEGNPEFSIPQDLVRLYPEHFHLLHRTPHDQLKLYRFIPSTTDEFNGLH